MRLVTLLLIIHLTGCSYLTDYLLKQDTGLRVDAHVGTNENKVETGIGSLGTDKELSVEVEDSQDIQINNTDDRYHITSEGETTVNVYETSYWLYAIIGLFLVGKPALTKYWQWRTKKKTELKSHEYVTYTNIHRNPDNNRNT